MKKSLCLFAFLLFVNVFVFSQSRFTVENVFGTAGAIDGSKVYDSLQLGTKLSCDAILRLGADGSVTISHPDLSTMVFKNEGKYAIKDRVVELGIISDCEVKENETGSAKTKAVTPTEFLKLNKPYTGVLVPGLVKVSWDKPKAPGSFIVEVSLPNERENPLASFVTDNTFVDLNLKALELTPGNEYCLVVKSKNMKVGPTEVKFIAGDFDEYRKVINTLKSKNQYLAANPIKREIMEADVLEKSKYLYLASSKYDKLLEKFSKNEEVIKTYNDFYSRINTPKE